MISMNYGTCFEGPWHGKQMAHAVDSYNVAIEKYSKRARVGVQESAVTKDQFTFGTYRWNPAGKVWVWNKAPDEAS